MAKTEAGAKKSKRTRPRRDEPNEESGEKAGDGVRDKGVTRASRSTRKRPTERVRSSRDISSGSKKGSGASPDEIVLEEVPTKEPKKPAPKQQEEDAGCCACCCGGPSTKEPVKEEPIEMAPVKASVSKRSTRRASNHVVDLHEEFDGEEVRGFPACYADVNGSSKDDFNWDTYELKYSRYDNYEIKTDSSNFIGEGAYGEVFKGWEVKGGERSRVAIKTIKPEKEDPLKIKKEIYMLRVVRHNEFNIRYKALIRDDSSNPTSDLKMMVFEFMENRNPKHLSKDDDIRWYLYKVLRGLNYGHRKGLMHRDIKSANVLSNGRGGKEGIVKLIDWGFGEFYRKDKELALWPGTRFYKAPELFLHYAYYDYQVDMWSFACMAYYIVFQKNLFQGADSKGQLEAIARELGTADYGDYLRKYSKQNRNNSKYYFPDQYARRYHTLGPLTQRRDLRKRAQHQSKLPKGATEDFYKLLNELLVWDHEKRLTAKGALMHDYFKKCREQMPLTEHELESGTGSTTDSTTNTGSSVVSHSDSD